MGIKFRKWEDISLDIDNCLQIIKYQSNSTDSNNSTINQSIQAIIRIYNRLCAVGIMNNQDKLYPLL